MNNEFKKIKTKNETRYILETVSSGATSAGAVATVPSNLGALRRRLQELKDKLSVPRAKPRNPVGMGSTQGRSTQKHKQNQRQTARDEKKIYELSKDTLKSYTKKANDEVNAIKKKQADHPRGHISGADADKKLNRQIGINQATKRIVKKDLTGVAEGSDHDDDYSTASFEKWKKQKEYEKEYDKKKPAKPIVPDNKDKKKGVAEESSLNELDTKTLVKYVPKAGRTLASLSPEKLKNRNDWMTRAYQKLISRPDFSDEIKKYHSEKYDELRDRIDRILIKAYNRYGTRDEVIDAAKPAAMKAAQELGAEKYFKEVWMNALASHDVDTDFGDNDDGFDYTDHSMRKGERGMEEEIGHDQVSPKQARYILRLAQDHSIEQIIDDFPELFRMMSIIAGERGLDLDDNWDDVVEILLNDLEDIVQQDNDQNYNDDDMREGSWGNFNSSDEQWGIDTDRYTGYRGVSGYRRREPDEQLPKSSMPSNRGMYFYNVKPGQEQLAKQAGLTQSKSGKWYSKSKIASIEKQFGPGKYWEPKSESTITELEKPSGTMFLKFRTKQLPDSETMVLGYGGFGTTPKDVKVSNALVKPFPADDSYDVINKMEKIFKDKDFIGIEKIVLDIPGSLLGQLHDIIDYAEQDPERFDLYTDNSDDDSEVRTGGKVIGYGPDGKRINREPAKAQVGGSSRGVANTGMVTVQADSTGQKLINGLLSQGKLSRDTKVQGNKITLRKDDYSKILSVLGNAKFQQMFSKTGNVTENDKPDHEISMASSELASITKDAAELLDLVKQRSEEEGLEAWQQSKITKAADYMNSVLRSISSDQELDVNEGLRDPKDNPCWKGYKPVGTKKKNGKTVPNCVPKNEDTYMSKLNAMLERKLGN